MVATTCNYQLEPCGHEEPRAGLFHASAKQGVSGAGGHSHGRASSPFSRFNTREGVITGLLEQLVLGAGLPYARAYTNTGTAKLEQPAMLSKY